MMNPVLSAIWMVFVSRLQRSFATITLLCFTMTVASADETFITIQKVSGNRMLVLKNESPSNRGRSMGGRGAASSGQTAGRGRRGDGTSLAQATTITVPSTTKITSAMRERRTFEFRVLGELPGGLRHRVFTNMQQPLQARIVTAGNTIKEVNVITGETDINQSGTDASGQTVIAVRPKRPPMKRKP
jgi:hypothetical protein